MSDVVIVSIVSLFGTFLGTFSGIKLMSYRIEQLEKKVEAMSDNNERLAVIENDIKNLYHLQKKGD